MDSYDIFLKSLEERLAFLEQLKTQFATQAELSQRNADKINAIGNAFQALSSINFTDTFQVVMKHENSDEGNEEHKLGRDIEAVMDNNEDGTGSTDYEII